MGAKLDSKIGLYFTYQSGPIFRAKTDLSDLQCIYFITEILFCWNEEGNLVEALFFVHFSIFPLKSWRNFIRSKTAELKFMDDAKLVACVQPPPPRLLPPLLLREGGSVHRLLNVLLCHWLRGGVSKICARRRNCGCVVCAKLNLPTFLRVNSFLPLFREFSIHPIFPKNLISMPL